MTSDICLRTTDGTAKPRVTLFNMGQDLGQYLHHRVEPAVRKDTFLIGFCLYPTSIHDRYIKTLIGVFLSIGKSTQRIFTGNIKKSYL